MNLFAIKAVRRYPKFAKKCNINHWILLFTKYVENYQKCIENELYAEKRKTNLIFILGGVMSSSEKITVYADGGCRGNGSTKNIGGYGAILSYKDKAKDIYGGEFNTTNNRMELMACIKGLESIKDKSYSVNVIMDSQYVITGITEWIHGWISKRWKGIANRDLWEILYGIVKSFKEAGGDITFKRVNRDFNSKADKLANLAMDKLERGEL